LLGWRKPSSSSLSKDRGKTAFTRQSTNRLKDFLADNLLLGELAEIGERRLETFI
jgi:hypothetical protein